MNMPGFSAEASLCKTSGHYHCMATRGSNESPRQVTSQLTA